MKKKLLFVMNNLNGGGAEKALISLLESLDYSRFDVDLFLFKHEGLFLDRVPPAVNIKPEPPLYRYFDMPVGAAIKGCLAEGKPGIALRRVRMGAVYRRESHPAVREQLSWKHISKALPHLPETYDAVIGFMEKNPLYFAVEHVKAHIRIGFIHNDYDKLGMLPHFDEPYFARLDYVATVSEECGAILRKRFPGHAAKIAVIHNIISPELIRKLAGEKADWKKKGQEIRILSIGRLSYQKGFEMAVEACRLLREAEYPVHWYIIGEGEDHKKLQEMIGRNGLQDSFFLIGQKGNPYPYLQEADFYVQPSRFEGKSIAIDEAKVLCKRIIVTDFPTAADQIIHKENGWIAGMDAQSISEAIRTLIDNEELGLRFASSLSEEDLGSGQEVEKFYRLVSGQ